MTCQETLSYLALAGAVMGLVCSFLVLYLAFTEDS